MKNNYNKNIATAILAGLGLSLGANAMAQNNHSHDAKLAAYAANPQAYDKVVLPGKVVHIGTMEKGKAHTTPLKGFAEDLPLITVLKQITPKGWIVKKDDTKSNPLHVQQNVSWKGGATWHQTLAKIANDYKLDFSINWQERTITVSNSATEIIPKAPPKVAIFELSTKKKQKEEEMQRIAQLEAQSETNSASAQSETNSASAQSETNSASVNDQKNVEKDNQQTQQTNDVQVSDKNINGKEQVLVEKEVILQWVLDPSKTLKENVQEWAKVAGYNVVWQGVNYPIPQRANGSLVVYTGNFDAENGPIHQVANSYGYDQKGAPLVRQPLTFQFFDDKTLLVKNATFNHK